MFVAFGTPNL